ncbi:MAG: hypothetical protein LBT47_03990 [Deltaproteobacteria bacterium]|jgi:putative two-component system response regulator|nr:hypothetical protein [Deltaproteobacteria bacterium]
MSVFCLGFIERLEETEEDSQFFQFTKTFIAFHHEKWNGSGYPYGLSGKNIPLLGRLMAIADLYDVLTSERPYKRAFSRKEAARLIINDKGTHFEPTLVGLLKAFTKLGGYYRHLASYLDQPTPRTVSARPQSF